MDLNEILQLSPYDLDEQQKDELCQSIKWFEVENINFTQLKPLFQLTQEILKYKDEQVESLIAEFDEIARKQGISEAKLIQSLENEIKSLKSSTGSRRQTPDIGVVKENEELKQKLRNFKSTIKIQSEELEKLKRDINILQEEKMILQSEIQSPRHDTDTQSESSEILDKQQQFTENIRQKNQQISLLLTDIETVEKENISLKEKILILRDKLDEATKHITNMTTEITGQNIILKQNQDLIQGLSEEKDALRKQIEELVNQKQNQDKHLENFSLTLDNKVDQLKNILEEKQSEINELKQQNLELETRLSQYSANINQVPASVLLEREQQIIELQTKLTEATQEIEKNTELLNNVVKTRSEHFEESNHHEILVDLKQRLEAAHERSQELQEQLKTTENDAQNQGLQLTEVLDQLRKYEDGHYGLSDALREIQDFRVQINVRDKQISELIQSCNRLQCTSDEIEQENLTLREKLGLSLDVPISKHGTVSRQRKQKKLITNLQNQIELLEDEKLQLKVELQRQKQQLSKVEDVVDKPKEKSSEIDYKNQFKNVCEENDALRKGMHEILESIRNKNDSSNREIKSETLEKLLQLLDVRHVSGWYHPAMRLQAELNTLQGCNDELRNQLKLYRLEVNSSNEQLKNAEIKINELQKQIVDPNKKFKIIDTNIITSMSIPPNISSTSADIISKLNSHLLTVLNEHQIEINNNKTLTDKIESIKQELNITRQQVGLLYKQYIEEKKSLTAKYKDVESEKNNITETLKILELKLASYIKSTEDETDGTNFGLNLSNDFVKLNRKCIYLEENEKKLSHENLKLKTELSYARTTTTECIKDLEIERNNLIHKVELLEKTLRDSIPKIKLELANKTIYDLTIKYNESIQNLNNFKTSNDVLVYQKQIELLNEEKNKIYTDLLQLKLNPKILDDPENLRKKLANSELKELTEKQRADHTHSLYELIRDQLKKCEERCYEFESQNNILLNTNLKLQLTQQNLQDQLLHFTTRENYEQLQLNLNTTLKELKDLKNKYEKLRTRYNVIDTKMKTKEMIKTVQNLELINIKHLLLDLQSNSDEKALIARLGTEVVLARICESDAKNTVDVLRNEIKQMNEDKKQKGLMLEESNNKLNNIQNQFEIKTRIFEEIIHSLRQQYLGCSPLSTQERVLNMLIQIFNDKQTAFNELLTIQKTKNDLFIVQEQLDTEIKNTLELKSILIRDKTNIDERIFEWYKDKNSLQLNEIRIRRNLEMKDTQLQQTIQRLKKQDNQLAQLEEELLKLSNSSLNNSFISNVLKKKSHVPDTKEIQINKIDIGTDPHIIPTQFTNNSVESQTEAIKQIENTKYEDIILGLTDEIRQVRELNMLKETNLQRQQTCIENLEKNIESLQLKLEEKNLNETVVRESRQQINVIDEVDAEEYEALKKLVDKLQIVITQKEGTISKYEHLLKEGRDEHSLAASRFQEEIKLLQLTVQQQKQAYLDLKNTQSHPTSSDLLPNRTAIEQYVNQVHILENHMADLETSVSSLNSQLQASRQESVRWRTLANDRLKSIETLRIEFNDQYQEEITMYKSENDKLKEETVNSKHDLSKLRIELNQKNSTITQQLQEKDTKIHELHMINMELQNEIKIHTEDIKSARSSHVSELALEKQLLERDYEALKKRFEQALSREKTAKEEIRNLRGQLINRPVLSAKTDRTERTVKEQLQKRINTLEKELHEAHEKLEKEASLNEVRRVKISEDFTLWEKQKKWQQTAEKYKEKLAQKTDETEKLQQSYSSAKSIISRLEREKHILEGKLKLSKNNTTVVLNSSRFETMEHENAQLKNDLDLLRAKLEMQQYHSGGLGAALLEQKLEAQERKIAILELSAKGTAEVTAELERLHNSVATLQKANLQLEAENLELHLDLKKLGSDTPYLREQIHHLERYIDVLKLEKSEQHVTNSCDEIQAGNSRKIQELEKTVLSLKRLVEKLQVENKRLHSRPCSSTSTDRKVGFSDKIQLELKQLKEQYGDSVQNSTKLQDDLNKSQKRIRFLEHMIEAKEAEEESSLKTELSDVKAQLAHKSQLLEKVKILLQKAAIKEKFLNDRIEQLEKMIASNSAIRETGNIREESDENS